MTPDANETAWTAVPDRADLEQARSVLEAWLRERNPSWHDVNVILLRRPTTSGGTGDNLLLTVRYRAGFRSDQEREEKLVVRLSPSEYMTVHEADVAQHFRILEALWPTDVPSPEPRWLELDESVLGIPFMVMSHAPGQAPSDFPIYNQAGFLADASVEFRRRAWESSIQALARVSTVDVAPFAFLNRRDRGATGLDQQLGYVAAAFEVAHGGDVHAGIARGLDWVVRNRPARAQEGLTWGDARLGNVLIDEAGRVTALLDWDRASVSGPLVDLGWWLLFDRLHAEDFGSPRLNGLGSRAETIQLWSELTGLSTDNIEWFEILSAVHLAAVRLRAIRMRTERGLWVPEADNPRGTERLVKRTDRMIAEYEGP